MEINKTIEGSKLTIALAGNLDTITSPQLQSEVDNLDSAINDLVFDFANLTYVSSAGLRVMLMANKKMTAGGGKMRLVGLNPSVREVFDMTGFSDIFDIA